MISILMITYGREQELFETLNCISNYQGDKIELLILDNNPTNKLKDKIENYILSKDIEFSYFQNGHNYGVAEGRNYLITRAKGDILITLDDDVEMDDITQLIYKVKKYFQENSTVGALAFNIKNFYSKVALRHEIPHGNKRLDFSQNMFTYYYIGAGHAIKKEVYEKAGLYPRDLGKYGGEERDLSFRILDIGYDILYVSDIVIYHKISPNGRMEKENENFFRYRNQLIVLNRYMPSFYSITSNIIWSIFYLLKKNGKFKHVYGVLCEINSIDKKIVKIDVVKKIKQLRGRVFF